jgi:hypothetical protein
MLAATMLHCLASQQASLEACGMTLSLQRRAAPLPATPPPAYLHFHMTVSSAGCVSNLITTTGEDWMEAGAWVITICMHMMTVCKERFVLGNLKVPDRALIKVILICVHMFTVNTVDPQAHDVSGSHRWPSIPSKDPC